MTKKKTHPRTAELQQLMEKHELTQSDVARMAGRARNSVHYWLKDKPPIPEGCLRLLKFELETATK